MPHVILEYSDNIAPIEFKELFCEIHKMLNEVGGISINNCKSRTRIANCHYIGTGSASSAFVHLDVSFLSGRSLELRQQIGSALLSLLEETYAAQKKEFELQITVEIREIERELYFKYPAATI